MRYVCHQRRDGMNTVEIEQIDLSYEGYRLRDRSRERALLSSISERGIMEPLQGVSTPAGGFLLLDGFKRYRCAKQLKIEAVVCIGIADDVASGILKLIRTSNDFSLHLVEQARLVTELHEKHGLNTMQIAAQLERSPAWVSMRLGLLTEMSPTVKKEVFSGRFPARSFMYTVRQFTRVHKAPAADVDKFVKAVSGKDLSGRAVDQLARAYFKGGENFREQILKGNFGWTLGRMEQMEQARSADSAVMGQAEQVFLRELEIAQKYEARIIRRALEEIKASNAFYAEAELLAGGIVRQVDQYRNAIGRIYDQCRNAKRGLDSLQTGKNQERDCAASGSRQENRIQDHQERGQSPGDPPQRQDRSRQGAHQESLQAL
jgi:ParB-like nuclease domain